MTKSQIITSVLYFILQNSVILDSQILSSYEYPNTFVQSPLMRGFFNHDPLAPYDRQVVIHRYHSPTGDGSFEYDDYVEFELNPRLSSYLVSGAYQHSGLQHINVAPPINMPYNPYYNSYNMPVVQPTTTTPATTVTPTTEKLVVTETIIISRKNNDVALTRKFNKLVVNPEDEIIAKLVNKNPEPVEKSNYILAMRNGNSDWKSIYGPGPFPHNLIEKLATTMQNTQGHHNGTVKQTLSLKLFRAS